MRWPRATLGSRVYMDALDHVPCTRSWCVRSWSTHSIAGALDRMDMDSLLNFHLLQHFDGKDLQHKKTLKLAKTLENDKAKGLTNIN
jgi:hypothetical protein